VNEKVPKNMIRIIYWMMNENSIDSGSALQSPHEKASGLGVPNA